MLAHKKALILEEVSDGTGAQIRLEDDNRGIQSGITLSFLELKRSHSPAVSLRPNGLNRFTAQLTFGNFATETIKQMQAADHEELQLARALIASMTKDARVTISGNQDPAKWTINDGLFSITVEKRGLGQRYDDDTVARVCRELVTPMLAAMAELYGYDPVEHPEKSGDKLVMEGALTLQHVRKRERNPRNKLLCLRIHGEQCYICSVQPASIYGEAGKIIEVHHLQPLALLDKPRAYDPATDLIPLCPNCHRAVHTRRPVPWSPEEILERINPDG